MAKLEATQLAKSYGGRQVIVDVSLAVAESQIVAC